MTWLWGGLGVVLVWGALTRWARDYLPSGPNSRVRHREQVIVVLTKDNPD